MKHIIVCTVILLAFYSAYAKQESLRYGKYCPVLSGPCQCKDYPDSVDAGFKEADELVCSGFSNLGQVASQLDKLRGFKFRSIKIRDGNLVPYSLGLFEDIESEQIDFERVHVDQTLALSLEESLKDSVRAVFFSHVFGLGQLDWHKALGEFGQLENLLIEHSPLETLPIYFRDVGLYGSSLVLLKLSFNSINCIEDLSMGAFLNVAVIDLSDNNLTQIRRKMLPICVEHRPSQTAPCEALEVLDLTQNQITHLPSDLLQDFPNLSKVILNNNHLMTIREAMVARSPASNLLLNIYENPIECTCAMRWIIKKKEEVQVIGSCRGDEYHTILETLTEKCSLTAL